MTTTFNARRLLSCLVTPRGLIFIICLGNFIVRGIEVNRLDRELRAYGYVEHWYPGQIMVDPFLSARCRCTVAFQPIVALLVSVLASIRVIYSLGYLQWVSIHYAHDVPMFSSQAMEKLWHVIYKSHLEYPFQTALAAVVFICACVLLARVAFRRRVIATVGE